MWEKIVAAILVPVLNWIYDKVSVLLSAWQKRVAATKKSEEEAKVDREKTEKAESPKEREDAASDTISHF